MEELIDLKRRSDIQPLCPVHPEGMAGPFDIDETTGFYSCQRSGCELHWRAASDYFRFFQAKPFRTFRQLQEETLCSRAGHGHKFIARRRGNKAVWECSVEGCSEIEEKLLSPASVWELPKERNQSGVPAVTSIPLTDDRGARNRVQAAKRRPGWVWIICIFYAVLFVAAGLSMYLIFSGTVPITPEYKAYLSNLSASDYFLSVVQPLLSVSAVVALFLLRKEATYLFWSSLAINVASDVWQFALKGGITAVHSKPGGSAGALIGFGIQLAVCLYAEDLKQRGMLT